MYHGIDLSNVEPRKVVDVERCHIATDGINEALPAVRDAARKRVADVYASGEGQRVGKKGATLLFRETSEDGCVTDNTVDVSEKVNGMTFKFKVCFVEFILVLMVGVGELDLARGVANEMKKFSRVRCTVLLVRKMLVSSPTINAILTIGFD